MGSQIKEIRRAKFEEQQGRCYYCKQPMWQDDCRQFALQHYLPAESAKRLQATAEHLIARQDGGVDDRQNIVAACYYCNKNRHRGKRALEPAAYRSKVQKRLAKGKWHGIAITKN